MPVRSDLPPDFRRFPVDDSGEMPVDRDSPIGAPVRSSRFHHGSILEMARLRIPMVTRLTTSNAMITRLELLNLRVHQRRSHPELLRAIAIVQTTVMDVTTTVGT